MGLTVYDWIRAVICICFIEGALYLFFPKIVQSFFAELIVDSPPETLKKWGALLLFVGGALYVWMI